MNCRVSRPTVDQASKQNFIVNSKIRRIGCLIVSEIIDSLLRDHEIKQGILFSPIFSQFENLKKKSGFIDSGLVDS